jgi:serine/threonine-protein kinase HipA
VTVQRLEVRLRFAPNQEMLVGTLAQTGRDVVFQYADTFLTRGLHLSPFRLPLRREVQAFDGKGGLEVFGLFEDAQPDGWGRRLLDRHFQSRFGRSPGALERLACVGERGMGALTFHPPQDDGSRVEVELELGNLGEQAWAFDVEDVEDALPEIRRLGGTSGGARPKALIGLPLDSASSGPVLPGDVDLPPSHAHWLVKFNARRDAGAAGPLEYVYARMAVAAGAEMPDHRLLETRVGRFFAVRRFDRPGPDQRAHLHSAAGLVHADFRAPGEEYDLLFRITDALTRDHAQKRELFRRTCLNVLAGNRDDHLKNFAYVMGPSGTWRLSPLYDFTHNAGPNGWHTLSVMGEGLHPRREHLLRLGEQSGLRAGEATGILDQVRAAVAGFGPLAREHGLPAGTVKRMERIFRELDG